MYFLNFHWTKLLMNPTSHPSIIHPTSRTITQPYIISLWACMYTADRWETADFPTTWVRLPLLSPLLEALNTFLTSQFSPINRQTSTCSQITQTLQQLRFFFFFKDILHEGSTWAGFYFSCETVHKLLLRTAKVVCTVCSLMPRLASTGVKRKKWWEKKNPVVVEITHATTCFNGFSSLMRSTRQNFLDVPFGQSVALSSNI